MKFDYSYSSTADVKYRDLFSSENITFFVFAAAVFFIPLIFGHVKDFPNQILVGSLVNALLALSALHLTFKKSLPIIVLPAIAAILSGFIFAEFTIFLVYLVPFIWLGNAAYVYAIKNLKLVNKMNYALAVFSSSLIKAGIIFAFTLILVSINLVPEIFLLPMGLVQFATAMLGGLVGGITLLKN